MRLSETLSKRRIRLDLPPTPKDQAIIDLIALAVADGSIRNADEFTQKVLEREALYSTGLAEGIAIPHAQDADVEDIIACVGVCPDGIEFDAMDSQPVQIIFLMAANIDRDASYLNLLDQVVRIFGSVHVRERVLAARSADEVIQIITTAEKTLPTHCIHESRSSMSH